MKPRKTRIKVVTSVDGSVKYIPQHKRWVKWYDFSDIRGISGWEHTNAYHVSPIFSITDYPEPYTLNHAQRYIDTYTEKYNSEESKRKGDQVVDVKYIKYP